MATKQKTSQKKHAAQAKDNEPEYVVQVNEPAMLRRDLLEGLREIIIFMQGYEKFRQIQEEKVATFAKLKNQVKDLNYLIDTRLRRFFPKGKLRSAHLKESKEEHSLQMEESEPGVSMPSMSSSRLSTAPAMKPKNELDELESQLKDIEGQLQNI